MDGRGRDTWERDDGQCPSGHSLEGDCGVLRAGQAGFVVLGRDHKRHLPLASGSLTPKNPGEPVTTFATIEREHFWCPPAC